MTAIHDLVDVPGPWSHRRVAANGARFHVAELGDGPLVLLVHGFPEFWWAWRHQIPPLAEAGYHVAAMDLRGFGGSDKTPRGYDAVTVSGDIAGVVQSLGHRDAVVVGHGWGGYFGWSTAVLHPEHVRGLAVLGMAHPLRMRDALRSPAQIRAAAHLFGFQVPLAPERRLVRAGGVEVERILRAWSAPGRDFPDDEAAARYRDALSIWPAPHCALEYHRWVVRSLVRTDGRRFAARMVERVTVPVLQIHGRLDPTVLPATVAGSEAFAAGPYRRVELECGHYPHEELPEVVTGELLSWLATLPPAP
jgi:pimeloyl-ACP methyl ester carboxylesterase